MPRERERERERERQTDRQTDRQGEKETEGERETERKREKHVTRGYNITADRWTGASNPHPHTPLSTHKHPDRLFFHFSSRTDRRTIRPMDGLTDKASHRVWS